MPDSLPSRWRLLAGVACVALTLAGCGRSQTTPASEGAENSPSIRNGAPKEAPLELQTEQKLDPLTKDDVALYLRVMRAAAQRVQNPAAEDKAALEGAKKILAGGAAGRIPTPDDVAMLARANLVATAMDQIVAEEEKLDARTYRGIAEAVESVVPNPALPAASGGNRSPDLAERNLGPLEARLREVNAANEKFLTPYRTEIQKLLAVVRNPANLPK